MRILSVFIFLLVAACATAPAPDPFVPTSGMSQVFSCDDCRVLVEDGYVAAVVSGFLGPKKIDVYSPDGARVVTSLSNWSAFQERYVSENAWRYIPTSRPRSWGNGLLEASLDSERRVVTVADAPGGAIQFTIPAQLVRSGVLNKGLDAYGAMIEDDHVFVHLQKEGGDYVVVAPIDSGASNEGMMVAQEEYQVSSAVGKVLGFLSGDSGCPEGRFSRVGLYKDKDREAVLIGYNLQEAYKDNGLCKSDYTSKLFVYDLEAQSVVDSIEKRSEGAVKNGIGGGDSGLPIMFSDLRWVNGKLVDSHHGSVLNPNTGAVSRVPQMRYFLGANHEGYFYTSGSGDVYILRM